MQIILLVIIVVALLYLSRYFPRIAFSILGLLVVGAGAIVLTTTDIGQNARSRIPTENIEIENPVMTPSYGGSYRFNARLSNHHSSIELRESIVSITLMDCADESESSCKVIGQSDQRINVRIPSGQTRDIERTLSFDAAEPIGNIRWQFQVTSTRS